MAKRYSEELAAWVHRRVQATRRDRNLVAFLALRGDVDEALENGFAVKTIWSHMSEQGQVSFGYDTFLNYVNRYIRGSHVHARKKPAPDAEAGGSRVPVERPTSRAENSVGRTTPGTRPDTLGGFRFNAAPNAEELI